MDEKQDYLPFTRRLLILYGSQTGKAWYIAQDLYLNCKGAFTGTDLNLSIHCYSLNQQDLRIEKETYVIFVVATVGEGECSYTTREFWRYLNSDNPPDLSELYYALFALGDSNYHHFAIFGKQLDARLEELGGKKICETGFGDDAVGIEIGYAPWLQNVIQSFANMFPANEDFLTQFRDPLRLLSSNDMKFSFFSPALTLPVAFSDKFVETRIQDELCDYKTEQLTFPKIPLMDTDIHNVKFVDLKLLSMVTESITKEDKVILEATFEGDEKFVDWAPGDAFGFIVGHSDFEVNLVLKALNLQDKAANIIEVSSATHQHLPKRITLFNLIKYYIDLRAIPKKANLRFFGDHCSVPSQRMQLHYLSSREGTGEYKIHILQHKTSILDILVAYDSCCPPLDYFLAVVPNFVPRYYSVLNLKDDKIQFKVAFSVIHLNEVNQRRDTQLLGVFTGLMYKIALANSLVTENTIQLEACPRPEYFRVFRKRNDHFKLPANNSTPIIMLAAGTGVTPFLGFLSYRQHFKEQNPEQKIGESFLFYGCRDSEKDFIYSQELEDFKVNGILTRFHPCFSRDSKFPKMHVQDGILKEKQEIRRLIVEENAVIYVCGDQGKFSSNVRKAFVIALDATVREGDLCAEKVLDNLKVEGRYLQDLWV